MKHQTLKDMEILGVDQQEAQRAMSLFILLRPGLKVKRNGRVDTSIGDKTVLGLYRTIKEQFRP
jgi:hypothetical protein